MVLSANAIKSKSEISSSLSFVFQFHRPEIAMQLIPSCAAFSAFFSPSVIYKEIAGLLRICLTFDGI